MKIRRLFLPVAITIATAGGMAQLLSLSRLSTPVGPMPNAPSITVLDENHIQIVCEDGTKPLLSPNINGYQRRAFPVASCVSSSGAQSKGVGVGFLREQDSLTGTWIPYVTLDDGGYHIEDPLHPKNGKSLATNTMIMTKGFGS